MRIERLFSTSLVFLILISITLDFLGVQKVDAQKVTPHVSNEILVRFHEGVEETAKESIRNNLGATLLKTIRGIRVEHWKLPEDITVEHALEYLKYLPEVEYAEPNILYKPLYLPNDEDFNRLWFLRNTGQSVNGKTGLAGADISAVNAWDLETGDHEIVIAVIDSGVAYDHPDLINNVWINTDEVANNGIDDDNNGYIDDVHGWDFVNNDNNPSDYSSDLYGDGHGTHVAGTIAAQGNNGIGISGVMWRAQIMPIQIFDLFQVNSFENNIIQLVNIINAIEYAVNNDAKIINCSFGGAPYSLFKYDAINYAHQKGVLLVIAAGNNSNNNDTIPFYPASYNLPNIISVAATNEKDELSSFSNYGFQSVDVAAPGGSITNNKANIYSTTPPEREIIFYDDFESGGSKWTTSGIYESWTLSYNSVFGSTIIQDSQGYYHNNENSNITTAVPINSSNYRGLHLQLKASWALEDGFDFIYFEGSDDGNNYITLDYATGYSNGIYNANYWTNDYDFGSFYLRFRLNTDYMYNYDGVYIDDIFLTGIPLLFKGNEYGFKSGTSMAAPIVAGIAGLIYSRSPNITHLAVKDAILKSVDKLDSLNGKISTGGRVNAYKVLTFITQGGNSDAHMIPRFRLYNPYTYHHHYTTDANEYNVLGTIGWIQEGTGCYFYNGYYVIDTTETVPYYRLYNPNSYEHHWTTDANEYNVLGTIGWIQEGADGFVFATQVSGSEPLYRLYNPNDGLHHWTMDTNERTVLIGYGFIDEGIACYVFP